MVKNKVFFCLVSTRKIDTFLRNSSAYFLSLKHTHSVSLRRQRALCFLKLENLTIFSLLNCQNMRSYYDFYFLSGQVKVSFENLISQILMTLSPRPMLRIAILLFLTIQLLDACSPFEDKITTNFNATNTICYLHADYFCNKIDECGGSVSAIFQKRNGEWQQIYVSVMES